MAKRGRKKKHKISQDFAMIILIIISVLLLILIYTKSGYIGQTISPLLGGIIGTMKYVLPLGTCIIGIYALFIDKNEFSPKLIQYIIVILSIISIMSINQIYIGTINIQDEFENTIKSSYNLGTKNIGGGILRFNDSNTTY